MTLKTKQASKSGRSTDTKALEYPFKMRWSPELAEPFEVCDGVFWLRTPLPMTLDHINLWLLRDGDQWVIVDTGFDYPNAKEVWEQVFKDFISPEQVNRIVVTHYHPDHIGLAAWLSHRCNCKVLISQGELDQYRAMLERDEDEFNAKIERYATEVGFSDKQIEYFLGFARVDDRPSKERLQRSQTEVIKEGDVLSIDSSEWQIVAGNGHSPEHSCLYNKSKKVLISGDQAIARISSNVSVFPSSCVSNPLADWISSCEKLRDTISNDTLILPAHQEPFIGIVPRMQALIDEHHEQLNKLLSALSAPTNIDTTRRFLFDRELSAMEILLATGETLAHLNYLLANNKISISHDDQGVAWYQAA